MIVNDSLNRMSKQEIIDKMDKGHSWISICREMERKGMSFQEINDAMDEAKQERKRE
jgi:hypothetical protein